MKVRDKGVPTGTWIAKRMNGIGRTETGRERGQFLERTLVKVKVGWGGKAKMEGVEKTKVDWGVTAKGVGVATTKVVWGATAKGVWVVTAKVI